MMDSLRLDCQDNQKKLKREKRPRAMHLHKGKFRKALKKKTVGREVGRK